MFAFSIASISNTFHRNDHRTCIQSLLHTSAHVVGGALEQIYGDDIMLADGPPIDGFDLDWLIDSAVFVLLIAILN